MPALNRVEIEGHAAADAELRYIGEKKTAQASFRIGVSEGKDEKRKTEWVNCVLWGKRAEDAAKEIKKGAAVRFEGKLSTRKWTDKEGKDRYTTEVVGWSYWVRSKASERDSYTPPANDFAAADIDSIPF